MVGRYAFPRGSVGTRERGSVGTRCKFAASGRSVCIPTRERGNERQMVSRYAFPRGSVGTRERSRYAFPRGSVGTREAGMHSHAGAWERETEHGEIEGSIKEGGNGTAH
ncbi:MAG: hypothetical protein AUK35_00300 [Zetaproteobacteria bacterium CG2_30_46_52]|nr:MAG: hypothetical protein AUK35_00300 [Zetaproteobacteria bacterium CG2_30_46_52]